MQKTKVATQVGGIIAAVCLIAAIAMSSQLFETVDKGTYVIKQAAVSGEMTAYMKPGMFMQNFGDTTTWPVQETFFFTKDRDTTDDVDVDNSIEVRFNDGSLAYISGTCRVQTPSSDTDAIDLMTKHGFRSYNDMAQKLILPIVRNSLRNAANLMTARESYSEKRADFVAYTRDQIENGIYKTEATTKTVEDPLTGQKTTREVKVIKVDADGNPQRESHPLEGIGVTLSNFEVKDFGYDEKVKNQIAAQQDALMAVATAKAQAEKAKQDAIKLEAEGKANVMSAKYEEEQKKIKQVVQEEAKKEVAIINGEQRKEVAELDRDAAALEKEATILRGEGQAKARELVLTADGALEKKLEAYIKSQEVWADAWRTRPVPQVMFNSGASEGQGPDTDGLSLNRFIDVLLLEKLGLDMQMPKTKTVGSPVASAK
jgi:regulator of protease activity HflC (stomatin/prohibitin superfamily)